MTGAVEVLGAFPRWGAADEPTWLRDLRQQARQQFEAVGYPTTHNENWRFTNVAPIAQTKFEAGEYKWNRRIASTVERLAARVDAIPVVFVNGQYCEEFSLRHAAPARTKAGSFRQALQEGSAGIEDYLSRDAGNAETPFVALNTASFEDGAFVQIPDGLVLDRPIHLIFISAGDGAPSVCHPRNLIIAGARTQALVIETYASIQEDLYFTNAVTTVIAGEDSVIRHCKVQRESTRAFHIAALQFYQARNSNVVCHSFSFGGSLVRNDVNVTLSTGAEGTLNGLYALGGKQHVDNHTTIDHAEPHAASRELYKGILDGHSGAVFNGRVIVRKDAQKTDAKQTNRNLLLSEDAVINTKPELQIHADDVRCTHGATIGQLDENALFYLRSRGIGQADARRILVHAFAQEVIDRIKSEDLRRWLGEELDVKLGAEGGNVS